MLVVVLMVVIVAALGLLGGDLGTDLVHVEGLYLTDQVLESVAGEGSGLGVENDLIAEHHESRDRADAELHGKFLLVFGIDLGENHVVVLL